MTPDDVMAMKNVGDAQISPDGKWVAYVVSVANLKEAAFNTRHLAGARRPAARRSGSPAAPRPTASPRWSPDGKSIAFVSAREERSQIWRISPFGGEAEKLTDSKSGVQGFQWCPDGSKIAYVALRDQTPEEERRNKEKDDAQVVDKNFRMTRIWIFDCRREDATEVVKDDLQVGDPQWSPDGTRIAYSTTPTPKADDGSRSDIWIVPGGRRHDRGSCWRIRGRTPRRAGRPTARSIAFVSRSQRTAARTGSRSSSSFPADGGTPREVLHRIPLPARRGRPGRPTASTLFFWSSVRTTSQLFSRAGRRRHAESRSRITRGVMSSPSRTRRDATARLAFPRSDPQHPDDVYVAAGQPAPSRRCKLTDLNPQVKDVALGRAEVVRWKSKDGMEIEGVVVYPDRLPAGPEVSHDGVHPRRALRRCGPRASRRAGATTPTSGPGKGWVSFFPNIARLVRLRREVPDGNVRDWGGGDYRTSRPGSTT